MTEGPNRQELYAKTREDLLKRQLSNNENLDRSILTLSSAALGLSVPFIRGLPRIDCPTLIILSWLSFVVAIIATICSYHVSQHGIGKQLDIAERYYLKEDDSALDTKNHAAKWNENLAYVSTICFVLGIILLLVFFGVNATP